MADHLKRPSSTRVQKSNLLVDAKYKINMWETRLFIKMVMLVDHTDEDDKEYRIYIKDIIDDFQLHNDKSAYRYLHDAADSLLNRPITIHEKRANGRTYEVKTNILTVTTKEIDDDGQPIRERGYVTVKFASELKPYMLELKEYTAYDLKYILRLPNSYSFRLYELLKRREYGSYTWKVSFEELKEKIGAIEITYDVKNNKQVKDLYPLFGSFKQKVLNKSQAHINDNTDIRFDFEPIKTGRKITHVEFKVYDNVTLEVEDTPDVQEDQEKKVQYFLDQVREYGVTVVAVRKWVATLPDDQIQAGINYTRNMLKTNHSISNVGGYMNKMVNTPDIVDPFKEQKRLQRETQQRQKKRQLEIQELQQHYDQLQLEYNAKEEEICSAIFDQFPDAKKDAYETAKKRRHSGFKSERTPAQNMQDSHFRSVFKLIVKERYSERFKGLEDLKKELSTVRGRISRLT